MPTFFSSIISQKVSGVNAESGMNVYNRNFILNEDIDIFNQGCTTFLRKDYKNVLFVVKYRIIHD